MNIKNIIIEEIQKLNVEGVADKYAQSRFGIPDDNQDANRRAELHADVEKKEISPKGQLVGVIGDKRDILSNVYMNPKSLLDFGYNVRALSDKKGNLYIADVDGNFYHAEISKAVNNGDSGIYIGGAYDVDIIQWHRIKKTKNFGFSVSYMEYWRQNERENSDVARHAIKVLQDRNPDFIFHPVYWQDFEYFK